MWVREIRDWGSQKGKEEVGQQATLIRVGRKFTNGTLTGGSGKNLDPKLRDHVREVRLSEPIMESQAISRNTDRYHRWWPVIDRRCSGTAIGR